MLRRLFPMIGMQDALAAAPAMIGLAAAIFATISAMAPAVAAETAADLRLEAERYAGAPAHVDPRLAVPECREGYSLRWLSPGKQLEAGCGASEWRMVIPVATAAVAAQGASAGAPARPRVEPRRGDLVHLEIRGDGYRVRSEGVVDSYNRRDGTVLLRNPKSGARFAGTVDEDGNVSVAANNR